MSYQPPYTITPKIIDLVSKISEAVGGFYSVENLRLYRINRIKIIQGTLAIEGNTLSSDQVTAIIDGAHVIAPICEIQEVQNAIKAYSMLYSLDPYSINDLLKAHSAMEMGLIDDAGRFRCGDVGVAAGEQIIHYAPPADRVRFLIADLFDWLQKQETHPLIASSVFHYEFVFIHPFSDGNGRTVRLWQTLLLSKWKPLFANMPVENIVYKYQRQYYDAIADSGSEKGCTPFIEFILKVIYETMTTQMATPITTQEQIVKAIKKNSKVSRVELARIIGITPDGVKYHLQKMTKAGVIEHKGSTRNGYWMVVEK